MRVDYGEGLSVNWTNKQLAKIAEIRERTNRKPQRDEYVPDDHPFAAIMRRIEQRRIDSEIKLAEAYTKKKELEAKKRADQARHKLILSLTKSGMSYRQIAKALGLSYGVVAKYSWRHRVHNHS